jgi:hypothetical protein
MVPKNVNAFAPATCSAFARYSLQESMSQGPFKLNQTGEAWTEAITAEKTSDRSRIVSYCPLVNRQLR